MEGVITTLPFLPYEMFSYPWAGLGEKSHMYNFENGATLHTSKIIRRFKKLLQQNTIW